MSTLIWDLCCLQDVQQSPNTEYTREGKIQGVVNCKCPGLGSFFKDKDNGITFGGNYLSELGTSLLLLLGMSHILPKIYLFLKTKNQVSFPQSNFPETSQNLASILSEKLNSSNLMQTLFLPAGDRKHSAWLYTLNSLNLFCISAIILFHSRGLAFERIHL